MISRICSGNFQQIHIISVSGDYSHFLSKICQIVAGTTMISQFHEFFDPIFGGFLRFGSTVRWWLGCLFRGLSPYSVHATVTHQHYRLSQNVPFGGRVVEVVEFLVFFFMFWKYRSSLINVPLE